MMNSNKQELDPAKVARREYFRNYYQKNKEKFKQYTHDYWVRKGERILQDQEDQRSKGDNA